MACSMVSLYDGYDYYKKLFELQEKLRKSEEERIRLEERFSILMRESRNRHDACINRLRMRYIQYLEEQRTRDERNYKLLATLDRVMNKLMLINVKKDRLNVLRKQYETYLLRVYANRRPLGSTTGDSGIASQNEDKYTRKTVPVVQPNLASMKAKNLSPPQMHPEVLAQSNQPRFISVSKFNDQTIVNNSLLNDLPILPTASLGTPLGVDYQETNVPRESHVYASPIGRSCDQLVQMSAIPAPDARQYLRTIPDRSATSRNFQDVPNLRFSYTESPPTAPSNQIQSNAIPVNRFFREHVESAQTAPNLSAATRFPARDVARYEEMLENKSTPHQLDPLTLLQYRNANLLSNLQPRVRGYDSSDVAPGELSLMSAKSSMYRVEPDTNTVDQIGPLQRHMDSILVSPQKSENEESTPSFTSDDMDDLIRRNEHLLWKNAETLRRSPTVLGVNNANLNKNDRMTGILENELDRYISNIQRLHREHGVPNSEELDHEQNTSGDLLNVTLSENALELPADDRKKERRPEMGRSTAANPKENDRSVRQPAERNRNDDSHAEIGDEIRHREDESDALEFKGKSEDEERGTLAKNEIREDVATRLTKLEQPHREMEVTKENDTNDLIDSRERNRKVSTIMKKDDPNEEIVAPSDDKSKIDHQGNVTQEKQLELVTGEESDIEGLFDIAEELAPWNVASVQKNIRELHLDDSDGDQMAGTYAEETADKMGEKIASESRNSPQFIEQSGTDNEMENAHFSQDTFLHAEMEKKKIDASKMKSYGENETRAFVEDTENMSSKISDEHNADESKITSQINAEFCESIEGNDKNQVNDETKELRVDDQSENIFRDNEYNIEQGYVEDLSQAQDQKQDQNEQYYSQSMPYEEPTDEKYEGYANQDYAQEGQEYVEYVDGQYGQYTEDLNNQQYEQYEQDPNQIYDYNYDPNQGYEGDLNQQYDPNQGYENNPNNQAYDYTEQVAYNPDQAYDNTYEQENKEEQHNRDDRVIDTKDDKEKFETEESSQGQTGLEKEYKSDRDEDEQQVDITNGANQSKKKKDVIKSLLDSDTDTTIERNVSNTESDFDFN